MHHHGKRDLLGGVPRNVLVEHRRQLRRLGGQHIERQPQILRPRRARRREHHKHQVLAVVVHDLKADDLGHIGARADRDRRVVGHVAGKPRRLGKNLVKLVPLSPQRLRHEVGLGLCLLIFFGKTIDVKPIAALAGDAPRRGVRLLEIPERFQLGHLVADGRGRTVGHPALGNVFRADRLAALDIRLDDRAQDLLLPAAESAFHVSRSFPL